MPKGRVSNVRKPSVEKLPGNLPNTEANRRLLALVDAENRERIYNDFLSLGEKSGTNLTVLAQKHNIDLEELAKIIVVQEDFHKEEMTDDYKTLLSRKVNDTVNRFNYIKDQLLKMYHNLNALEQAGVKFVDSVLYEGAKGNNVTSVSIVDAKLKVLTHLRHCCVDEKDILNGYMGRPNADFILQFGDTKYTNIFADNDVLSTQIQTLQKELGKGKIVAQAEVIS